MVTLKRTIWQSSCSQYAFLATVLMPSALQSVAKHLELNRVLSVSTVDCIPKLATECLTKILEMLVDVVFAFGTALISIE